MGRSHHVRPAKSLAAILQQNAAAGPSNQTAEPAPTWDALSSGRHARSRCVHLRAAGAHGWGAGPECAQPNAAAVLRGASALLECTLRLIVQRLEQVGQRGPTGRLDEDLHRHARQQLGRP